MAALREFGCSGHNLQTPLIDGNGISISWEEDGVHQWKHAHPALIVPQDATADLPMRAVSTITGITQARNLIRPWISSISRASMVPAGEVGC